jgi:hypothetical protein
MDSENGNKILGIGISIFLDFGFWRDLGFSPQEGFGEECGLDFRFEWTIYIITYLGLSCNRLYTYYIWQSQFIQLNIRKF